MSRYNHSQYPSHAQARREFFADNATAGQCPATSQCPMEYINVTKTADQITVDAKSIGASTAEAQKVFRGPQRFQEYDQFWRYMTSNLPNFGKCVDPLANDPERAASASTSVSGPSSTTNAAPNEIINNPITTGSTGTNGSTTVNGSVGTNVPITGPSLNTPVTGSNTPSNFDLNTDVSTLPESNPPVDPLPNLNSLDTTFDTSNLFNNTNFSDSLFNSENDFSFNSNWTLASLLQYLFRIAILFGLIFIFVTIIPRTELDLFTRLLIATVVVVCYAMLGFFRYLALMIKRSMCASVCGCSANQ